MDEREWLDCTDPKRMLESLGGRVSERKARLFGCACCRRVMRPDLYERGWRDVEASEQYAERAIRVTAYPDAFRLCGLDPVHTEAEVAILHDLFGNPVRPLVLDYAWRTPLVLALAQAAYDQRSLPTGTLELDRLAILADALEEAGCTDPDILGHLRGPGPHVRGCFVLDTLLDKS